MRKFGEGEEAVSPVIGVILMVGLTVMMVSTIAVSVYSFSIPESAPQAKIVVREARGGLEPTNLNENLIVLRNKGGDILTENETKIIIRGRGTAYPDTMNVDEATAAGLMNEQDIIVEYHHLRGSHYDKPYNYDQILDGDSWSAGEVVSLAGYDGGDSTNGCDQKWRFKAGTVIIVEIIDIPTSQIISISQTTVKHV
ncbi:MAG: type IV pilin N-terminal domain-containing protein [Euryarchaeota archaeon]|nr:type IV pilin N-terminal domain-containing protein [Euryarchaeota archaeon]MBU4491928.1 type IV pilin N-terminal domain-containing protein [Euryarchaeota archaeon]